jgi:hypothetical protein
MPDDIAAIRADVEVSRTRVVQPEAIARTIESDLATHIRANAEQLIRLVASRVTGYAERPVRLASATGMELRKGKLVGTKASAENGILRH